MCFIKIDLMEIYYNLKDQYNAQLVRIIKKYNTISFLRLVAVVLFLVAMFYLVKTEKTFLGVIGILFLAAFIVLMRIHTKISNEKKLKEALVGINQDEIDYLKRKKIPFETGFEFNDFQHPYAYDLDVFGEQSLFQNLNRTFTFAGKKTLANQLVRLLPNQEIIANQGAVQELSQKLDWRQDFMAAAKISNASKASYETLMRWRKSASAPISKAMIVLSFVSPVLFGLLLVVYWMTSMPVLLSILTFQFMFHLALMGKFFKRIKGEINEAENIDKIIVQYGLLVRKIEKETFTSDKLKDLQKQLVAGNQSASIHLKQLSILFSRMDSIGNFVSTLLFNGTFLFHLHTLKALIDWKEQHAEPLEKWLDVIGEFEMLNSLANFSYNNPKFVFPELNADYKIVFSNLSHPLLNEKRRVGNEVGFERHQFVILTGSNMSGKSTFLRSLGVNMVLTGIGSAVCADKADVHPLPVLVSMRLSDSLSDSESYFYAEIKRLKQIMDGLEKERAFVLLDEILRGTNSDDKRSGTIEVVKKMIASRAIGAIATHDIEVCLTTDEYPDKLTNKCFEVEIIDNDLYFDYRLREGICRNKSATFLMEKMGVI